MVLLQSVATPPAADVISPAAISTTQAYAQCLDMQSLKLEPSGADVDDIFEGARTACAKEWADAYDAVVASNKARPPSPTGKDAEMIAVEFLDLMTDSNKPRIRLQILQRRAAGSVR